ncbi:hypothetical protein CHARACLAT_010112 [Characodon lateralis]|uniref:Uncharacterized protein n=1 Tax=Characodon lateralis TaxID=208331 RepID=A0ABU7DTJ8_9TELE|nr:hypothetical protein [Characodon lateralis]
MRRRTLHKYAEGGSEKHARTLASAAWQPLVSLTQLLCCLTHSQQITPTRTNAAAQKQPASSVYCLTARHHSERLNGVMDHQDRSVLRMWTQIGQMDGRCDDGISGITGRAISAFKCR